ncbi:MAG: hypothetical protein ABUS51_08615 [Acidobacteriota bacterium]
MEDRVSWLRRSGTPLLAVAVALTAIHPAWSGAWKGTGPFGGAAEIVRTSPAVSGLVLAGAHNGLLYVSRNGGAWWSHVPFPGQFAGVLHALEIDPRSASTWYAGMEGENSWTSGIYKTTDGGQTWTLLPPTKGLGVWSIALWPGNPDVVAAGTSTGVYLSKNAGAQWSHISTEGDPELRPVVSLAFHPSDSGTLYAGTTHLPWRTTDGGRTWQSIHDGMIDDSDVFSIQVDPLKPSRVFASACSGVYGSMNGAERWSKLALPGGAFRTYFVAIDPQNDQVIFAGTTQGLMRSADGGRAWRSVSTEAVKAVAFDSFVRGRVFFASTTAGLLVSTDGGNNLRESNFGFTNRNFTTLTGAGGDLYSSSVYEPVSGGVYRTENQGLRWVHAGDAPAEQLLLMAAVPDNAKLLFAAGYHGLLKSADAGKTWTNYKNPPPGTRITALLPVSSTALLIGTEQGLFRTQDGVAWTRLADIRVDSLSRSGATRLFALTASGALHSEDGGSAWKKCGEPQPSVTWYGLAFDTAAANTALAATSAGLFRSTDNCQSWTPVRGGLRAETASLVLFHPTRPAEAFVSQGGKVYVSVNGGLQWSPLDEEAQGNSGPSSLFVLPSVPDKLFALFPRRGVFSASIPAGTQGLSAEVLQKGRPDGLSGEQSAGSEERTNNLCAQAGRSFACTTTFKEKTFQ